MVLEKILESPLDGKEIKPGNPKGNQPWINWKDWCWSSNTLATWFEELTHFKTTWCWKRLRVGGKEGNRGWDGWMTSPTQRTWIWANSRRWWRTGKPGVLQSVGSQRVRQTEQLNNNKDKNIILYNLSTVASKRPTGDSIRSISVDDTQSPVLFPKLASETLYSFLLPRSFQTVALHLTSFNPRLPPYFYILHHWHF